MVVSPTVATVGPLGAHYALSRIVLEFVLGGVVGDVVGAADDVSRDVVRTCGNGGGDRPRQVDHRISNLPNKTPPRRHRCWRCNRRPGCCPCRRE